MIAVLAAENRGFLKNDMSSIGWSVCSSQPTKPTRAARPMANAPSTEAEVQPASGPSMMPNSRNARVAMLNSAPGRSRRGAFGSFDSGTKK